MPIHTLFDPVTVIILQHNLPLYDTWVIPAGAARRAAKILNED